MAEDEQGQTSFRHIVASDHQYYLKALDPEFKANYPPNPKVNTPLVALWRHVADVSVDDCVDSRAYQVATIVWTVSSFYDDITD